MDGFQLEINRSGRWEITEKDGTISPTGPGNELRITVNRGAYYHGRYKIMVYNCNRFKGPFFINNGESTISLGTAGSYVTGTMEIYLEETASAWSVTQRYTLEEYRKSGSDTATDVFPEKHEVMETHDGFSTDEIRKMRVERDSLRNQLEAEKKKNKQLLEAHGELKALLEDGESVDKALQSMKEKLESKKAELDRINETILTAEKETERVKQEKKDKEEELGKLSGDYDKLVESTETKRLDISALQRETEELENRHTDAERALAELIARREELGMKDRELAEAQETLKSKELEIEKIKKEIESRKAELQRLMIDLERETAGCASAEAQLENILRDKRQKEEEYQGCQNDLELLNGEIQEKWEEVSRKVRSFVQSDEELREREIQDRDILTYLKLALENKDFNDVIENLDDYEEKIRRVETILDELHQMRSETEEKIRRLSEN